MKISFDVKGKPPKKSEWGKDDAHLIVEFRQAAFDARMETVGCMEGYDGPIKLSLTVFAPNITNMDYKQTGDDDPGKFVGDLDSLVAGVCEYLQPAPTNPDMILNDIFEGKDDIAPRRPLIIKNDAQIVEINAKKMIDDALHYFVEIEYLP